MIGRIGRRAARAGRRMIRPAMLAGACAVAVAGIIAPTSASAASLSPSGCSGNYVVGSAPLKNESTGVASWNYGYVQLWYSNSCAENWTRVVSLRPGTTFIRADLYRQDGGHECGATSPTEDGCYATGSTTVVESPPLYSPVLLDAAFGLVVDSSGTQYDGYWAQPGF